MPDTKPHAIETDKPKEEWGSWLDVDDLASGQSNHVKVNLHDLVSAKALPDGSYAVKLKGDDPVADQMVLSAGYYARLLEHAKEHKVALPGFPGASEVSAPEPVRRSEEY